MTKRIYEGNEFPMGYLLTFRTFGTWLHGDERSSISRRGKVLPKSFKIEANIPLNKEMSRLQKQQAVILDSNQRECVRAAVVEVCEYRDYTLHALNVRTNHNR